MHSCADCDTSTTRSGPRAWSVAPIVREVSVAEAFGIPRRRAFLWAGVDSPVPGRGHRSAQALHAVHRSLVGEFVGEALEADAFTPTRDGIAK